MRFMQQLGRVIALCVASSLVAACGGGGGGGSHGFVPTGPGGTPNSPQGNALFKVTLPANTAVSGQSRSPKYLSSQGTSSLVVSVVPTDPAEASVWATTYGVSGFTLCYNIFNNGAAVATNPAVVVTVGPPVTVSFPFPSPPGQDTFTVTQYAGACASAYAAPIPPAGVTAAQLIISQSTPLVVNLLPGVVNNFNTALFACGVYPAASGTCAVPGAVGTITPTLGGSISFAYMAGSNAALPITLPAPITLPIPAPMREQGAFTAVAANQVGFPIPIVGLDGTGHAVPFTAGAPPSSGLFPKGANNPACSSACTDGLSITHTEVGTGPHFKLLLVDATTGAIAQNAEPITLTQINALDAADAKVGGVVGDPYVLVGEFDGSSSTVSTSATVTLNGTINGTAIAAQTLTVMPQSSLFTAVAAGPANGYADAAAPYTKAADILNTNGASGVLAAGQGYWVSDGTNMHLVGGATYPVTGTTGTTNLTGMTLFNNTNLTAAQILVVDNGQVGTASGPFAAGSGTPVNSGIFVFDPVSHTSKPLAVQYGNSNYIAFANPQAVAFVGNPTPPGYAYVAAGGKIYAIDLTGNGTHGLQTDASTNFYLADLQSTAVPVSGLNAGTDTGFDMFAGTSAGTLVLADTGNNRIVSVNVTTGVVTVISAGHPYVGVSVNGTGYVATDTAGQIYTITGAGVATSLGLTNAVAPKDGVVGVIGTTPLAPAPYTTQGQTTNFFGSASVPTVPYNIAPFSAAGPVFTVAPAGLVADTSNATFGATAGNTTSGFGIAFVSAAGANTALTSNSYLFTDNGLLRTLVP